MNFKENKAIYLQIADRICDEILLGKYKEEERIPSVREYAAIVEVNANTVMRSFEHLQTLNIIHNKRGIGYFVSASATEQILSVRRETFKIDDKGNKQNAQQNACGPSQTNPAAFEHGAQGLADNGLAEG